MNSSTKARVLSLVAFLESRDRQLELPFGECGDDDRQEGGRFGPGNDCGGSGSGGGSDAPAEPPQGQRNRAVTGMGRRTTENSFPVGAWNSPDAIDHSGGIPGADKIKKLQVFDPRATTKHAKSVGIKSAAGLLRLGAATSEGADVGISHSSGMRWNADGDRMETSTSIVSSAPIDGEGRARTTVSIQSIEGQDSFVYYDHFQVDSDTKAKIAREKANSDTGASPTERKIGASIIGQMLESLATADEAGLKYAKTLAAGSDGDSFYKGYRLWGRFGFDGPIDSGTPYGRRLIDAINASPEHGLMTPEQEDKFRTTGAINLQELLSTKAGEKWWSKNGGSINLKLDFSDRESLGYKRFKDFLEKHRRAKKREERDYLDFIDFVCRSEVSRDLRDWPGFRGVEQRNCGTGSGGFQKGNTCAGQAAADVAGGAVKGAVTGAAAAVGKTGGFPPAVATGAAAGAAIGAVKGLYDNRMRPTRAGKAIKRIGTSDEQVASLVKGLGGSPKSVAEADGKDAVTLSVKDSKGGSQFDVRMTKSTVTIKPSTGRSNLTSKDIKQIKKIAQENSPKSVEVVVDAVPTSTLAKIVKAGGSLAVNAAGSLVAAFVLPTAPALAGTAIEATTGIDIEKTKASQWVGEKLLGNLPKRRG